MPSLAVFGNTVQTPVAGYLVCKSHRNSLKQVEPWAQCRLRRGSRQQRDTDDADSILELPRHRSERRAFCSLETLSALNLAQGREVYLKITHQLVVFLQRNRQVPVCSSAS